MSPVRHDVLDASQVEDLRGIDDGAMLARLVGMYLSRTPERIKSLRTHVEAKNFKEIAREAHTLKGASGSIGAARVAEVCRKIEQAGTTQAAKPLEELVPALETEFGLARDALQAMANGGKPGATR